MPRPIAEILADEYVVQGYQDLRVQEHIFEQVDKIIVRVHRDLAKLVKQMDPAEGASVRKTEFLERRSKKLIDTAFKEITKLMDKELAGVAELEVEHTRSALRKALTLSLEDEL